MSDFLAALGLALAIEGALYAMFPVAMKKMLLQVLAQPYSHTRIGGTVALAAGVGLLWLVRG